MVFSVGISYLTTIPTSRAVIGTQKSISSMPHREVYLYTFSCLGMSFHFRFAKVGRYGICRVTSCDYCHLLRRSVIPTSWLQTYLPPPPPHTHTTTNNVGSYLQDLTLYESVAEALPKYKNNIWNASSIVYAWRAWGRDWEGESEGNLFRNQENPRNPCCILQFDNVSGCISDVLCAQTYK